MGTVRVPLSEQEEAHVALVLDLHTQAIHDATEAANRARASRFAPILRAKLIPDGATISVVARSGDQPACLTYSDPEAPGDAIAPPLPPDAAK